MMERLVICEGCVLGVPTFPMIDRRDGGNLWVMPPREVWDRSELAADELIQWSFLIAAAGRAMLDVLPQLSGGVVNYWEAGNWALNELAEPKGPKTGNKHKTTHMHLIGRSPKATDPDWKWGEAPRYPTFEDAHAWWSKKENLTFEEQRSVAARCAEFLVDKYHVAPDGINVLAR